MKQSERIAMQVIGDIILELPDEDFEKLAIRKGYDPQELLKSGRKILKKCLKEIK